MKKIIIVSILSLFMSLSMVTFAQTERKKGPNSKAYEHANNNAIFNRISDWFATIGKSKEEKDKVLEERRAKREAEWAAKEAKRVEEKAKKAKNKGKKEAQKQHNKFQNRSGIVRRDRDKH